MQYCVPRHVLFSDFIQHGTMARKCPPRLVSSEQVGVIFAILHAVVAGATATIVRSETLLFWGRGVRFR